MPQWVVGYTEAEPEREIRLRTLPARDTRARQGGKESS
jgi:hypothetical protein